MDTSSSSENTPLPKSRTGTVTDTHHRMVPASPGSPVAVTSSPKKRHHHRQRQPPPPNEAETEPGSEMRKPRLPKPKPRKFLSPPAMSSTAAAIPSAPPARSQGEPQPPTSPTVPKTKKRQSKKSRGAGVDEITDEPEVSTGRGDGLNVLRIQDILHAFQDDVVTVKSSQRNKWQEKLDEIQSNLLFPELEHRKFETVSGGDGGSVPSKWKSAASLIPRDSQLPPPEGQRNEDLSILKLFRVINHLGTFSSGIVSGLLLWKALFAVSQIISGQGFPLSPFFWILFWTLTSVLLLVTVLGFLNSDGRIEAGNFSVTTSLLRFIPCMMMFGSYYLSKAFDLQVVECGKYLEVKKQLHHVHPTYNCDESEVGESSWENLSYWKISLDIFPALASVIIYALLHFRSHQPAAPPPFAEREEFP